MVDTDGRIVGVASRRLTGDGLGFASRADALPELLAQGSRSLSPFGGALAAEVFVASQDGAAGGVAGGVRAEVALRDRVLLDAAALVPFSPRWSAARFGSSASGIAEGRAGLRQRFGRGSWSVKVDGFGGVSALQRMRSEAEDPLALHTTLHPAWLVGGTVRLRSIGFEVGWLPAEGMTRASAILRWPGVLTVF